VLDRVRRDVPFYDTDGGMTLTGGEPTQQPDFAEALLRLARAEGIATALESCGHVRWEVWERLLPHLDAICSTSSTSIPSAIAPRPGWTTT